MNIKRSILFILLAIRCFGFPAHAQAPWSHIYDFCQNGTFKYKSQNAAQYADDSFFIAAGYTYDTNKFVPYIARFDYNGTLLNSKIFHFSDQRHQFALNYPFIKTGDNRYLVIGLEFDHKTREKLEIWQPFFYFFNKAGDSLQFVQYQDTIISYYPMSIMQDAQDNIVVSGMGSSEKIKYNSWGTGSYYYDTAYCWLAKYDSNANIIWNRKYYGFNKGNVWIDKVILGHDKLSYLIGGTAMDPVVNYGGSFIAKTDTAGNIIWRAFLQRPFGTATNIDIIALTDGNYAFISSYSDSALIPNVGISNPYIFYGKFDEQGNILWTRYFRKAYGDSKGQCITEATNGDLLLMGDVSIYPKDRVALIRTTGDGDIRWYREYYHIDTTYMWHGGAAMSFLKDNQILVSGTFQCNDTVENVFDTVGMFSWFVLTDTFGCQAPGCQQEDTMWHTGVQNINAIATDISVYPNPALQILNIKTGASAISSSRLRVNLCDINGRKLQTKVLRYNNAETLDLSYLPPGIYLLEVWEDGRRIKRMKVEHY